MRIADILKAKPDATVITIGPDAGVRELLSLLAEHNVGALIVSTDGESLDGIVSERDVVRHLHTDGTDGPWGGNALASNGHLHDAALSFLGSMPDGDDDPDWRPTGPGSVSELRPRGVRPESVPED